MLESLRGYDAWKEREPDMGPDPIPIDALENEELRGALREALVGEPQHNNVPTDIGLAWFDDTLRFVLKRFYGRYEVRFTRDELAEREAGMIADVADRKNDERIDNATPNQE